jgi:hypothetical protein
MNCTENEVRISRRDVIDLPIGSTDLSVLLVGTSVLENPELWVRFDDPASRDIVFRKL